MSSVPNCVFCNRPATIRNKERFAVCRDHKDQSMPDMKCVCGEMLTQKESKYGPFFICPSCGPISLKKAMGVNTVQVKPSQPRIITVRSDELDFII